MSLPAPVGYIRQTVWEEDRFLFYSNFLSAKNEKMWFAQTRSPQLARTIVEETGWMASRDTRLSRRALVDVIDSVLACVGEPPLQPLRHHRTVILDKGRHFQIMHAPRTGYPAPPTGWRVKFLTEPYYSLQGAAERKVAITIYSSMRAAWHAAQSIVAPHTLH